MIHHSPDTLLVTDVQLDFCPGGALAVPNGDAVVPPINAMMGNAKTIILTQDWHPADHLSFASQHPGKEPMESVTLSHGAQVLWPDHCVQGTEGAALHPDTHVSFSLINRSADVPLARLVDPKELREQLDHVRTLSLSRGESTFLRGNLFYGSRAIFRPEFIEWLEALRLPPYHLERKGEQYELTFEGKWPEVMMWEIPALAVIMELRSRAVLKTMGKFDLQVLYARAMTRLWEKVERLRAIADLRLADFGTRRRHGFLW